MREDAKKALVSEVCELSMKLAKIALEGAGLGYSLDLYDTEGQGTSDLHHIFVDVMYSDGTLVTSKFFSFQQIRTVGFEYKLAEFIANNIRRHNVFKERKNVPLPR